MANGMASLMVGASGMKSAQTALNTTAHNLSNINTIGYTRQQISFNDVQYVKLGSGMNSPITSTYGLGVGVEEIRRIRDEFIDKAYRSENSRLGFYSSQYNAIVEVEDQFGEMQGVTFQQSLTNLYDSINELSKETSSTVKRSAFMQSVSAFMTRADAVYKGLTDYQVTLNVDIANTVNRINTIGNEIYRLNKQIAKIEAPGIESANDYRDQRDALVDELSEYMNITYYESDNGELIVDAESVPFVGLTSVAEMTMRVQDGTNLYIPEWPAYERDVYSMKDTYAGNTNADKGKLKGLLYARGSINVDYTDVPVKPEQKDYDLTTTEGQAKYQADYEEYLEKQEYYDEFIEPSVILSAIAGLDKLVNGIVTAINDVLCPEKEYVTANALLDSSGKEIRPDTYSYVSNNEYLYKKDGTKVHGADNQDGTFSFECDEKLYTDEEATTEEAISSYNYRILDMDKTDYGMDDDKTVGQEIFSRENTSRYIVIQDAAGNDMYVKNCQNTRGDKSDYKLGNILVNPEVAQDVAKIPMTTLQGKEDMDRGQALLDIWSADFASLNPEQYAVGDFNTFYNNFIGEFATMGRVLGNYVDHQQTMVDGYDNQRLQTAGVSSDEELQKMIKFQQAYNASSRYVNVISEMLEHLVTSLGSM